MAHRSRGEVSAYHVAPGMSSSAADSIARYGNLYIMLMSRFHEKVSERERLERRLKEIEDEKSSLEKDLASIDDSERSIQLLVNEFTKNVLEVEGQHRKRSRRSTEGEDEASSTPIHGQRGNRFYTPVKRRRLANVEDMDATGTDEGSVTPIHGQGHDDTEETFVTSVDE